MLIDTWGMDTDADALGPFRRLKRVGGEIHEIYEEGRGRARRMGIFGTARYDKRGMG